MSFCLPYSPLDGILNILNGLSWNSGSQSFSDFRHIKGSLFLSLILHYVPTHVMHNITHGFFRSSHKLLQWLLVLTDHNQKFNLFAFFWASFSRSFLPPGLLKPTPFLLWLSREFSCLDLPCVSLPGLGISSCVLRGPSLLHQVSVEMSFPWKAIPNGLISNDSSAPS